MKRLTILAMSTLTSLATDISALMITSEDFCPCGRNPARFTGEGRDINPQLEIADTPPNTKSLVLVMDDQDAPAGTFTHWLLWNISPTTTTLQREALPAGAINGKNDFGTSTYRGPKPPSGKHRYFFRVYALDTLLDLVAGSDRKELESAMKGHILAESALEGTFSSKNK
jgi:Raf kinase inhibitor-like YbhB/YbcL family protein